MTEEEYFRKNYPDSCYGDKPLSPHWDFFQGGVEFGERQSEKKIADLKKRNRELEKEINKYKLAEIKAKEIIRELLSSCFGYNSKTVNYEVKVKAEAFLKEE